VKSPVPVLDTRFLIASWAVSVMVRSSLQRTLSSRSSVNAEPVTSDQTMKDKTMKTIGGEEE
jgi:hypothetical protein